MSRAIYYCSLNIYKTTLISVRKNVSHFYVVIKFRRICRNIYLHSQRYS